MVNESSIVLLDNHDSFVHNLGRYLRQLGQHTAVIRSDAITAGELARMNPPAIVLSPGPCTPNEAGCSLDVVRLLAGRVPILGVCLGHQVIGQAFGAQVVAGEPCHGRATQITHRGDALFAGLPSPLTVGRYHSLVLEPATLPAELVVTAVTDDGTVMAVEGVQHRVWGVQFHPESLLTEGGYRILANFLRQTGAQVPQEAENLCP